MISRPILCCSHWLEFVYTQNAAMTSFYNVMRQHLDYVQDVIFEMLLMLLNIKTLSVCQQQISPPVAEVNN